MSDPPPEGCEVCGEGPVTKVLHPVPVFFKGSGFYSTDYGRGKRKKDGGGEGDGGAAERRHPRSLLDPGDRRQLQRQRDGEPGGRERHRHGEADRDGRSFFLTRC